jgi:hypothetical protein
MTMLPLLSVVALFCFSFANGFTVAPFAGIEIVSNNEGGGNDVSGNEVKVNLGYECDGATPDENKCGRLQTLDQVVQSKNDNASNCENKLRNRGEGMKGSEEARVKHSCLTWDG